MGGIQYLGKRLDVVTSVAYAISLRCTDSLQIRGRSTHNFNVGSFSLIAAGAGETDISIANPLVWTSLVRSYGCK